MGDGCFGRGHTDGVFGHWDGRAFPAYERDFSGFCDALELGLDASGEGVGGIDNQLRRKLFKECGACDFADGSGKDIYARRIFLSLGSSSTCCRGNGDGDAEVRDCFCDEVSVMSSRENPYAAGWRLGFAWSGRFISPPEIAARPEEEAGSGLRAAISKDERGEHIELAFAQFGEGSDFDSLIRAVSITNDAAGC